MTCAWQELLSLLPHWLRQQVDRQYKDSLQELRLRLGLPPQLIYSGKRTSLGQAVTMEDLKQVVNMACRYSPWTATGAASGYITAPGGHRLGLCGEAVVQGGHMTGIQTLRSVNIRVARDFPGIARQLATISGSILILGRPGSGKTTLLRDLLRQLSHRETVCVADQRGELFPSIGGRSCLDSGNVDVLTGCAKAEAADALLRAMSPDTLAMDEITAQMDTQALLDAAFCGVRLIATAHAGSVRELYSRPIYKPLVQAGIFDTLAVLQPDKSCRIERGSLCKSS